MSKTIMLLGAVAALSGLFIYSQQQSAASTLTEVSAENPFFDYIAQFGKHYTDNVEFRARFNNFVASHRAIQDHNSMNSAKFRLGHNQFSDWSEEEWNNFLTYKQDKSVRSGAEFVGEPEGPVDWREKGIINDIKDQGSCGSCWAFSAQGAFEARWAQIQGKKERFSESLLVDCDTKDSACNGGLMKNAFDWLKTNANVYENHYPYLAAKRACDKNAQRTNIYAKER